MGLKPIAVSFKQNEEDKELHDWILQHSNYSGFIKDVLRGKKESEGFISPKTENKPQKQAQKVRSESSEVLDLNF